MIIDGDPNRGAVNSEKRQLNVETPAENVDAVATELAAQIEEAKKTGDEKTLKEIAERVAGDSGLVAAIEENKEASEVLEIPQIRQAFEEFEVKFVKIVGLANQAIEARAITHSLFASEEEKDGVVRRVMALREIVFNSKSRDEVKEQLDAFAHWYKESKPNIMNRMRGKVGYFGGSLPSELRAQADMFMSLEEDVDNMQHYLNLSD